jgi:uncharacterized protein YjiK
VATPTSAAKTATPGDAARNLPDTGDGADRTFNSLGAYDMAHPDRTWNLPDVLREISDISLLSETSVACVQDERGTIYIFDLNSSSITDSVRFADKGDYEGLAVAGSKVFVLRSDGRLFELERLQHHPSVAKYALNLPTDESEGLCYDGRHRRLLIAPKIRKPRKSGRDVRPIHAFDLKQMASSPLAAFEIDLRDVRRFAKRHDLAVPRRPKKDGEGMHTVLLLAPSAIAVHPITGDLFVLSAADHVLISSNDRGRITGYALLDSDRFRQPEGMAFFANGDLLISNEGSDQAANLLLFHWKDARRDRQIQELGTAH